MTVNSDAKQLYFYLCNIDVSIFMNLLFIYVLFKFTMVMITLQSLSFTKIRKLSLPLWLYLNRVLLYYYINILLCIIHLQYFTCAYALEFGIENNRLNIYSEDEI
jgi:hypothetical protein